MLKFQKRSAFYTFSAHQTFICLPINCIKTTLFCHVTMQFFFWYFFLVCRTPKPSMILLCTKEIHCWVYISYGHGTLCTRFYRDMLLLVRLDLSRCPISTYQNDIVYMSWCYELRTIYIFFFYFLCLFSSSFLSSDKIICIHDVNLAIVDSNCTK